MCCCLPPENGRFLKGILEPGTGERRPESPRIKIPCSFMAPGRKCFEKGGAVLSRLGGENCWRVLQLNKGESFTGACSYPTSLEKPLPRPAWRWVSNQLVRKEPVQHPTSANWGKWGAGGTALTLTDPARAQERLCPGNCFLLSDGINLRSY